MIGNEIKALKQLLILKDQEINRQIEAKKLAVQTRNWVVILTVLIHLIVWMF